MGGTESSTFLPALTNTTQHITQTVLPNRPANAVNATHKPSANGDLPSAAVGAVKGEESGK